MDHYAHLRALVSEQVRFCNLNTFALRICTLYFQSSVFQYLNFDTSCSLSIIKIGQGQPIVTDWINLVEPEFPMPHTKFQGLRPFKSWEESLKGFYHIWARRISWSCDPNYMNKLSFPPSHTGSTCYLVSISLSLRGEDNTTESEASRTKVIKWPWPVS